MSKTQLPKNVIYNRKTKTYIVQLPTGSIKTYKTEKGATSKALRETRRIDIPSIVIANTYFWKSQGKASNRRSNERRHQSIIDDFCAQLNIIPTVEVSGSYSESCHNVYKTMIYRRNGNLTNLTGLVSECKKWGIELLK